MEVINFTRAECRNCYKCVRNCPVKAIRIKEGQAEIVLERCITCGTCLIKCPQNAKTVKSDMDKVNDILGKNEKVAVSLAPSFAGIFSSFNPENFMSRLKELGFKDIFPTSQGAILIAKAYANIYNDKSRKVIISSACPAANYLVQKYYPELINYLVPVVSPMIAHGMYLKRVRGYSKVIFIGPCLAKKMEAMEFKEIIDAVITFDELKKLMGLKELIEETYFSENDDEEENEEISIKTGAALYPIPGETVKTFSPFIKERWRREITVHGLDDLGEVFEEIKKGKLKDVFIEANACRGGCSSGPATGDKKKDRFMKLEKIREYAGRLKDKFQFENKNEELDMKAITREFTVLTVSKKIPSEEEIRNILRQIGKYSERDELNCGACGYDSCREKAIAVYNGMAEIYMCIPYMRTRAESISELIIESTPNAIVVVDKNLQIQEYNPAAEKMFKKIKKEIIGMPLDYIFNDDDFRFVAELKENIIAKKVKLPEYNLVTLQSIYFLHGHDLIIGIISDITKQEEDRKRNLEIKKKTIETTQQVIEKQMRVAQEIASVLGETTAETKVLLNRIKSILKEELPDE